MQQTTGNDEEKQQLAQHPQSQPLPHVPIAQVGEDDDGPEVIFAKAVAEIDTQPLPRKKRAYVILSIGDLLELLFDVCLFVGILFGSIYLAITYPHTLVLLYEKVSTRQITMTLDLPTRSLAPVTLTRSATIPTTGTGHQDATKATGQVTFYNGLATVQAIPAGTVFTGRDGEQLVTTQDALIPALDPTTTPPALGQVSVSAQAVRTGTAGNMPAYDVSLTLSNSLIVKNLSAFTGGRDERTFRAVAAKDLETLTSTVNVTVAQAFTSAFPLQPGEAALLTRCTTKETPDHQTGAEAQTVTLTASKTCSAVAYNQGQLVKAATAAFSRTRPASTYHVVGSVQTSVQSLTPLTVTLSGKWAYSFTADDEQHLAQQIQGDTPEQARAALVRTGVISYASIPTKLPPAMYINFVVLVA